MTRQCTTKSASEWYALWQDVENQIAEEYVLLAGVKKADNGQDSMEFTDRIKALKDLAQYYEAQYNKQYDCENNVAPARMKTFNNGL